MACLNLENPYFVRRAHTRVKVKLLALAQVSVPSLARFELVLGLPCLKIEQLEPDILVFSHSHCESGLLPRQTDRAHRPIMNFRNL